MFYSHIFLKVGERNRSMESLSNVHLFCFILHYLIHLTSFTDNGNRITVMASEDDAYPMDETMEMSAEKAKMQFQAALNGIGDFTFPHCDGYPSVLNNVIDCLQVQPMQEQNSEEVDEHGMNATPGTIILCDKCKAGKNEQLVTDQNLFLEILFQLFWTGF